MNLTNTFLEVISLTNLAIFVNRLIVDGNYETALFLYDDASVRDTHFIRELTSTSGNYTSIILRSADILRWTFLSEKKKFLSAHNELPIIMMSYDQQWDDRLLNLMTPIDRSAHNYVFLLPMHHYSRWGEILQTFQSHFSYPNTSVVFYQTPHMPQNEATNHSIEVFVNSNCFTAGCSILDIGSDNDTMTQLNKIENLHEFVFEKAMKKTMLFMYDVDSKARVRDNRVMLNNSNQFMANFIARNLRNISMVQLSDSCFYKPKNDSFYAELCASFNCSPHKIKYELFKYINLS